MLEQMRRQGASIFVYLIFCLLILIFVINFRPGQSRQDDNGCRGASTSVISVDGVDTSQTAYKIAFSANNGTDSKQKTIIAFEVLVRRELLAQAAEARGLLVDDDLVMNEIKKGHFFFGGQTTTIPGIFDKDHYWNLRAFQAWYQNQLNVSRNSYIEEQKRGMLAAMMADILKESVQVSRDEALSQFLFENNTATYDVVAFKPETYRSALQVTDADIDRWAVAHADEISARYKADERLYKGTKAALQLSEIFIAKSDGSGGMTVDAAKAKLEDVKKTAGSDKAKFAAAAKDLSTDPAAKTSGGMLGWRNAENPALGDKALSDAVKPLKPGETTAVITNDKGAYLIMALDRREGDLKLDQVKHEIAETLAKDAWSKEAAKRAAIAALDGAHNSIGMNLDQMYKPEEPPPGSNGVSPEQLEQLEKMLNDPNTTPQQKQMLQQLLEHGPTHGQLERPSKDVAAGWLEDDSDAAGSAVVAAGSAAAPAVPAEEMVASKDVLPAMSDVAKPNLQHVGPAPREKKMAGLGESKAAIAAVFDELQPGNVAKQVYAADGGYVVVQLRERQQPNVADFDKNADDRVAQLRDQRAHSFLESWMKTKCQQLAKDKKIIAATDKLTDRDENGKLVQLPYKPCMSFR